MATTYDFLVLQNLFKQQISQLLTFQEVVLADDGFIALTGFKS